ncbi:MAG: hypothetical protein DLM61_02840 [Pseudonocardiales bacterium]|nr:MAG: hypothetical protein DLM61_02840 [Pseudonocardiales bacterium]
MTHDIKTSPLELIAARADLPVEDIDPGQTLEDIGLDSLSLMEIALSMQSLYAVDIPEGALSAKQTVESAVSYLHDQCA